MNPLTPSNFGAHPQFQLFESKQKSKTKKWSKVNTNGKWFTHMPTSNITKKIVRASSTVIHVPIIKSNLSGITYTVTVI